jgi:hypothetical protein
MHEARHRARVNGKGTKRQTGFVRGASSDDHLSVRGAAAVLLDRLLRLRHETHDDKLDAGAG